MPSAAYTVFERLTEQVDELRSAATVEKAAGRPSTAASMRRACIVLTIASLDTYVHERAGPLLKTRAAVGPTEAAGVANYLQDVSAAEVTGETSEAVIRWRLSYKTLAAPYALDKLLTVLGLEADTVWRDTALAAGSRPERLKSLTQVQYDRRNQIAHEGDWDHVAFDFRRVSDDHVADCLEHVRMLVTHLDAVL